MGLSSHGRGRALSGAHNLEGVMERQFQIREIAPTPVMDDGISESELKRRLSLILGHNFRANYVTDADIDILLHGEPKDKWQEWIEEAPNVAGCNDCQFKFSQDFKAWLGKMPRGEK